MQELFLGKEKVSLLERCPHFRGVLRERFHCIRSVKHKFRKTRLSQHHGMSQGVMWVAVVMM